MLPGASVRVDNATARRVANLAAFLERYRALADMHVRDFFVHDVWSAHVPAAWHHHLDALALDELASLLCDPILPPSRTGVWPLSLIAFFATVHALRLPNQLAPRGGATGSGAALTPGRGRRAGGSIDPRGRCADEKHLSLSALRMSVKPKKMHEIVHAAALIDRVGRAGCCARVVDVGSGLGYLSRTLAHEYAWPVVAVEGDESNVAEAARIDVKIGKKAPTLVDGASGPGALRHVAARLQPATTPGEFWRVVAVDGACPPAAERTAAEEAAAAGTSLLTGLHTCGDLAPTSLRVFHHAGEAVGALVSVGCCYHKLSEAYVAGATARSVQDPEGVDASDGSSELRGSGEIRTPSVAGMDTLEGVDGSTADAENVDGFPMSDLLRDRRMTAGYMARELACHSLLSYANRLRAAASEADGGEAALRHHVRRAVLEVLLARRNGCELARSSRLLAGVGSAKGVSDASFEDYISISLRRCGLPPPNEEEWPSVHALVDPMLAQWRRIVATVVLRLLLGPLWEALVLLDRLLYLDERGHRAALLPLFDPSLSPRSYALVAIKEARGGEDTRCWPCDEEATDETRWADAVWNW